MLLGENQLTGPLPKEWGQLNSLEFLGLQRNRLQGDATRALESWSNLNLRGLILHDNQLSGRIKDLPRGLFKASPENATVLLFGNHFSCELGPARSPFQEHMRALVLPGNRLSLPKQGSGQEPWYEAEVHSPLAQDSSRLIFTLWLILLAILFLLLGSCLFEPSVPVMWMYGFWKL